MRKAFYMAYEDTACRYITLDEAQRACEEDDAELVSAAFITPYPPGFPVLVPGQVLTSAILRYLTALDVKEIHGYDPEFGLRVFRPATLGKAVGASETTERETTRGAKS